MSLIQLDTSSKKTTLLIASTNPGKIQEIRQHWSSLPLKIISLNQLNSPIINQLEVKETGTTFLENATIKAKAYGNASNLLTLADDSGLIVDALNGRPGVYSRRYGSTDQIRIQKLLTELDQIPKQQRTARFEAVIAIYNPNDRKIYSCSGKAEGYITTKPIGSQGFGYDPIFYSSDLKKTFAQATTQEKNQVSHRSRALNQAIHIIEEIIDP